MESQILDNVTLGEGTVVHPPVVLGFPPRGREPGELPLVIGPGAVLRPFTTIYAGTTIGARFQSGQGASIREENVIGDDCSVGTNAILEFGNRIGNRTRVHSGCFLEQVTVGDDVFLAPCVVFTDDPHPPCPRYSDCKRGAVVEDLVKVGANATILPGVRIGRNSMVAAGAVVTQDVPPDVVVAGAPARVVKRIDELTCWPGFFERPYVWEPFGPVPRSKK
jgi:acetyltransferase-like isoleucine patch superfamily enzyme